MRRPSVYRALSSLSSTSAAATATVQQKLPLSLLQIHFKNNLSLVRVLTIVWLIGTQLCCILATTSIEATSLATNTQNSISSNSSTSGRTSKSSSSISSRSSTSSNSIGEDNNLYFDAFNTTKTISSTAVGPSAATTANLYVSQIPAETISPTTDSPSPHPLVSNDSSTRSYKSKTSIKMPGSIESSSSSSNNSTTKNNNTNNNNNSNSSNNSGNSSTPIKNPNINSDHDGSVGNVAQTSIERLPAGLMASAAAATATAMAAAAATSAVMLKSVRSTSKQPSDSTRSRNHWIVGDMDAERPRTFRSKHHHEHHWGPFFEEPLNTAATGDNLVSTAHLFTEAVLNCRVGMLKDKTVMWVRRTTEKVSLLTVGNVTYSGDPRIRVKFQYPNNWRLLINPTQKDDAGIYMCQVSTHPPRVFTTNLTVLEPPLRIIDEHERDVGDRYYKSGSTVDLQCQVSRSFFQKERLSILKSIEPPNSVKYSTTLNALNDTTSELNLNILGGLNETQTKLSSQALEKYFSNFITWAKDEEPLQAVTNKRASVSEKWLISRISISDARLTDSGNYTCSLGRLFTVIVQVQVLTGELPAAVQHNLASIKAASWILLVLVKFLVSQQNLLAA